MTFLISKLGWNLLSHKIWGNAKGVLVKERRNPH
jgi:hypothetical protein